MLNIIDELDNRKKVLDFVKRTWVLNNKQFSEIEKAINDDKFFDNGRFVIALKEHDLKIFENVDSIFEYPNYRKFRDKKYENQKCFSAFPSPSKNKKYYLVISNNPADILFQSTEYSFTNCLDFKKNLHFKTIIQQLLNKHRCIMYITDGSIKITENISTYKILSYCDFLIGKKDSFAISRFYPISGCNLEDIVKFVLKSSNFEIGNNIYYSYLTIDTEKEKEKEKNKILKSFEYYPDIPFYITEKVWFKGWNDIGESSQILDSLKTYKGCANSLDISSSNFFVCDKFDNVKIPFKFDYNFINRELNNEKR